MTFGQPILRPPGQSIWVSIGTGLIYQIALVFNPGIVQLDKATLNHFTRHGGSPFHFAIASSAQAVVLSRWQEVHGFGMPYFSVISGEMNRNVCA